MPLSGIDHVVIAVEDLEHSRMAWTRLGFNLTPRGRHLQQSTANYCIMFPRDYLELIGSVDGAQGMGDVAAFLGKGEGPKGLAFATPSLESALAELTRAGLHPGEPRDLTRQLELPRGAVLLRFKLATLRGDETPGLDVFICQHLTPHLVRQPDWLAHPNGAAGLEGIVVLVGATEPVRQAYERLFGAAVNTTDEVVTVHLGAQRVLFVTPDDFSALYPEAASGVTLEAPAIAALRLKSRDLALTADWLTQWQVAHEEAADGTLLVPPEEANGTLLMFGRA
jgi:hypothetical protein